MQREIDYHLFGAHVRFGRGCAQQLPGELKALGLSRPAVLMQKRMHDSDTWARLRALLSGWEIRVYGNVPTHGDLGWLEAVAGELAAFGADCIVAIGGGSVSDSAKALSMALTEEGPLTDHVTRFTPPSTVEIPQCTRPKLPIISLPTTASGAEVTPSFGARSGDHKLLFWNRNVAAKTVLIDPDVSADIPVELLRYTALNGLAHCFEGMYSKQRSIVADSLAIQSLVLFAEALESGDERLDEQRESILLAGHISGLVLSMAKTCLHHAICHVIGARHAVGHGLANTVILPHALRFNEPVVMPLLEPALQALNRVSGTQHPSVSAWVSHIVRRLGMPASLSGLGISHEDLKGIADQTMLERGLAMNPREVRNADEVLSILEQAL